MKALYLLVLVEVIAVSKGVSVAVCVGISVGWIPHRREVGKECGRPIAAWEEIIMGQSIYPFGMVILMDCWLQSPIRRSITYLNPESERRGLAKFSPPENGNRNSAAWNKKRWKADWLNVVVPLS